MSLKKITTYILFAYAISWIIWLPQLLNSHFNLGWTLSPWLHFFGGLGPIAGALITTFIFDKQEGLAKYLKERLFSIPSWKWIVVGVGMPILFFLLSYILLGLFTGTWDILSVVGLNSKIPVTNVFLIWLSWCLFYGLGEEGGWRGFLFPELTKKYRARFATLIVACIWALWHVPVFFYDKDLGSMGLLGIVGWLVGLIFGSLLLGWLVKQSKWNLWPVIFWHGTFNLFISSDRINVAYPSMMSMMVIVITLVIARTYGENLALKNRTLNHPA